MPSRRPSPHARMDAAAARSYPSPSPPRSKKRSTRSKPRAADRRRARSPNPNPSPRRRDGLGASASTPSRKSERKRKPRSFADSASLAMGIASPGGGGGSSQGAVQKLWTNADEVALLKGSVAFRARRGIAPRLPDMRALFESLRGALPPHIDQSKVYYKLKRLKSKFLHSAPGATSSSHERRVRDLCADLWGAELAPSVEADTEADEPEEEEEEEADDGYIGRDVDVAVRLPVMSEVLGEYWRRNARALSGVSLEKGLALLRAEEGREAETKWRRQLDSEMRTQARHHDLAKEVYGLLIDSIKGLGP